VLEDAVVRHHRHDRVDIVPAEGGVEVGLALLLLLGPWLIPVLAQPVRRRRRVRGRLANGSCQRVRVEDADA
jgi:hypothetical protein